MEFGTLQIFNTLGSNTIDETPAQKINSIHFPLTHENKILLTSLLRLNPPSETSIDLKKLNAFFLRLENAEAIAAEKERLAIKQAKLLVMRAVQSHLMRFHPKKKEEATVKPSRLKKFFQKLSYGFLVLAGLLLDGTGSFLGIKEMLGIFSFLSNTALLATAITFTVVNAALFYSFEVTMLKQAFGITTIKDADPLIKCDNEELNITQEVSSLLLKSASKIDTLEYQSLAALAASFNQSIAGKRERYTRDYPEKLSFKILRHAITGLGAIMVAGGALFMAKSLMLSVAVGLVGTPIGWTILGFSVFTSLAFYLSMRGKAMVSMQNPAVHAYQALRAKLDSYQPKTLHDFKNQLVLNYAVPQHEENQRLTKTLLSMHIREKKDLPIPDCVKHSESLFVKENSIKINNGFKSHHPRSATKHN